MIKQYMIKEGYTAVLDMYKQEGTQIEFSQEDIGSQNKSHLGKRKRESDDLLIFGQDYPDDSFSPN